ncbi:glycosyltransferase [Actinobacillus pleuropneumoniae]|uniref:glycosyltransferase n=1 Tax=Actinobacillus pleuropneumoniae TaxID=715 RepID=UPI003D0843D7
MQAHMQASEPIAAVVTATIGKPSLEQAILSVKNQTIPCKHYVFVDGKQYWKAAKEILDKYPDVIATYLPMNTGQLSFKNSAIFSLAPFTVKEEFIGFLDDDNWFELQHMEEAVRSIQDNEVDYAYSLRNKIFVYGDRHFICQDTVESIGHFKRALLNEIRVDFQDTGVQLVNRMAKGAPLVDASCYVMRKNIAIRVASAWYEGAIVNDRNVLKRLTDINAKSVCVGKYNVNYRTMLDKELITSLMNNHNLNEDEVLSTLYVFYEEINNQHRRMFGGKFPWEA